LRKRLRDFYRAINPDEARHLLEELQGHCLKRAMPAEVQKLGRTIRDWFAKICNYHLAKMSNGPTEALNNPIPASSGSASGSATSRTTHPSAALRRHAELANPGLDRRPMGAWNPSESDEPVVSEGGLET
jgi:hypothetical protein